MTTLNQTSTPHPLPVRIAMAQMLVQFSNPEANLARAKNMIDQAAAKNAHIIILPEVLDLGWPYNPASNLAQPIPGPRTQLLANAAKENHLYILAGLTERAQDRIYNAAIFLSPEGKLLHLHRKINTLQEVEPIYAIGDRLAVVPTPFGTVGIDICADSFAPMIPQTLCKMGANMILSPCAWAVPPDHDNTKTPYGQSWLDAFTPICKTYHTAFIAVSNVGPVTHGPWKNWNCIGNSLALAPDATLLARANHGPNAQQLLTIDLQCTQQNP
jgi:predicted amidohydrolase